MTWLFYELGKHPEAQARLREEIDGAFALPDFDASRIYDIRTRLPLVQCASSPPPPPPPPGGRGAYALVSVASRHSARS